MSRPDWLIVYDEGAGFGHLHRVQALAARIESRGSQVQIEPLVGPCRAPRLVVDSYRERADDRGMFAATVTVAFDDLHRDLAVDCVVDPSPGASACGHRAARHVLAGAAYTVIDPIVTELTPRAVRGRASRVLVTCGGTDHAGVAAAIASEIAANTSDVTVLLPTGPWWDGPLPDSVETLQVETGLAPDLSGVDVVVSGGGLTMCEALALGRPTVALIIAENQRPGIEYLTSAGAIVPSTPEHAAHDAAALIDDLERRQSLSIRGRELVDGRGADRVAESIMQLAAA